MFGSFGIFLYFSTVRLRDKDMENEMYLEGIGWVREITKFRANSDGVNEPYVEYEIIEK